MGKPIRVYDGRFGRLQLLEVAGEEPVRSSSELHVVFKHDGADLAVELPAEAATLSRGMVLIASPGAQWRPLCGAETPPTRLLQLQAAPAWLQGRFPAAFDGDAKPAQVSAEPVTQRIRQLADTLAVEVLNDQFLSPERLEFMLEELMLSIVETYLARRQAAGRFWRGSPLADSRIRRALALLRARPNKEFNIDDLASRVGLSRSRFYDLFQVSTGHSPRAYRDMLCIETAIAKLSAGEAKIADVSAELGFSAQSNFTRFFQHQVGIPPSEYRAALRRPPGSDPEE